MKRLIAVVEGDGDVDAVPGLLSRALTRAGHHEWIVDERRTFKLRGLSYFRKRLAEHAELLRRQPTDAALILFDLEDDCPRAEALSLAEDLRAFNLPFPVAVVFAYREYEAWLLASLETIAPAIPDFPDEARYDDDPEAPRDCKIALTVRMPGSTTYEPPLHQRAFTQHLDFDLAHERSRSFRRFCTALDQLAARVGQPGVVTPE